MTAIRLERVTKTFGETRAVDGVTLTIADGELTFLLGPSGCGKTTILRMIAGFLEPTSGRIYFGDRDVSGTPANRRNAGMVFQSYALWPHMTVEENVGFGLAVRHRPRAEIRERVDAALKRVRMSGLGGRKPGELSGGQQQRVALARALVFEPQVLLLDEPLSNLDAKLRLEMRTEIRRICSEFAITTIYVTHDQDEALSMADRIVVLRNGAICQTGSPVEMYRQPRTRFVADFLGETNFVEGRIERWEGDDAIVATPFAQLRARTERARLPQSGSITVSLRPEALRVADGPPSGANAFAVTPLSTVYLGRVAQHRVTTGAVELTVLEQNPRPAATASSRQTDAGPMTLHIAPDDVVLLAD